MSARKSKNPTEREDRLRRVSDLYLARQYQSVIGERLGISQQQVSYDLRVLRDRWRVDASRQINERKQEELARIDRLEMEAWNEWERSKSSSNSETRTEQSGGHGGELQKSTQRIQDRLGDPRYLIAIQWCIQKRVDILGIDAPAEVRDVTEPERIIERTEGLDKLLFMDYCSWEIWLCWLPNGKVKYCFGFQKASSF